jgi:hypothetical protein
MNTISNLWYSKNESDWVNAWKAYWDYVRPTNLLLEQKLNNLDLKQISDLNEFGWYHFLHDEYFRWKYTAPNRYKTTTNSLKKYLLFNELTKLDNIRHRLLNLDHSNIIAGLRIAQEIYGLGIAGASGLLSLMYPQYYATVDQFVVKALMDIERLPEIDRLKKIKPESLTLQDGVFLINILSQKATENNITFKCTRWTPRKIDMILWAAR